MKVKQKLVLKSVKRSQIVITGDYLKVETNKFDLMKNDRGGSLLLLVKTANVNLEGLIVFKKFLWWSSSFLSLL